MERTSRGTALEHRTVRANGIDLHLAISGPDSGPPVLLLHGFPEFWYGWHHQLGALAQAGYRCIAPDLRGYNLSSRPVGGEHFQPEVLVADIVSLLDVLGIERAHLVGHDWGGLIGWWMGERHPDRLRSLCILNAPHPQVFQRTLLRRPTQQLRSGYLMLFQLPIAPEFALRQNNYWLLRQMLLRTSGPGTFTDADLAHYCAAWAQPGALEAMLSWYRAIPGYASHATTGERIRVRTLILWGERDIALDASMAPESLDLCVEGRLERLPRAGHWLHHEMPNEISRHLVDFIGASAGASASAREAGTRRSARPGTAARTRRH